MHSVADILSGLILVALATTLVAHKETKGIVESASKGFGGDLLAAQGTGTG